MHGLDPLDGNDDGTVFRDVIMLALLGFVTIVILLLPHLNLPVEAKSPTRPPGTVTIEVRWADDVDADVDLWVQAPGDRPVGYSNRGGRVFNLLRDDRGHVRDPLKLNYEVAYSRGAPAGEYTVNLHFYQNKAGRLPLAVVVTVKLQRDDNSPPVVIAKRRVELTRVGQELTVVRFSLDGAGKLVAGSVHELQRPLRTAEY